MNNGLHNYKARTIKTALLRKLSRTAEAAELIGETLKLDPIDAGAMFERKLLFDDDSFDRLMREDNEDYRDLAFIYASAGFTEEAVTILETVPDKNEPLYLYSLYDITGEDKYLDRGEKASSDYCFPNRIEDITVL